MEYTIAPFSKQNIADFPRLYKAVYGKHIALDDVVKKFDTSYLIAGYFGYFAYDGSKAIAFYAAIPVRMCYKNETELAAQSVNTMTHPDYSGKGLFTKLAQMTYDKLAEAGIRFVWGFPNQNSEPGFLSKLGWEYQHRLEGYSVKIPVSFINTTFSKIPLLKNFYANRNAKFFSKYRTDNLLRPQISNDFVTVCRDKDYYDYKSFYGNFVIQIDNCLFWLNLEHGCWIGDVAVNDEAELRRSFQKLKLLCRKSGIPEIMTQTSPEGALSDLMINENSSCFESWIAGYKNFNSNFPLEKLHFTLGDADIF